MDEAIIRAGQFFGGGKHFRFQAPVEFFHPANELGVVHPDGDNLDERVEDIDQVLVEKLLVRGAGNEHAQGLVLNAHGRKKNRIPILVLYLRSEVSEFCKLFLRDHELAVE